MSKHTPGPWRLEEVADDNGRIVHLCPCDSDDQSILTVVDHQGATFAAVYIDADARLISAAPELLSFVERYIEHFEAHDITNTNGCNVDATGFLEGLARAAIAKATGEAA